MRHFLTIWHLEAVTQRRVPVRNVVWEGSAVGRASHFRRMKVDQCNQQRLKRDELKRHVHVSVPAGGEGL